MTTIILRTVLAMIGVIVVVLGLNIGLGGMQTLGWQIDPEFLTVTNPDDFAVQNNHIRFVGGVWFAIGLLFIAGSFALESLRTTLIFLCIAIAIASSFRFSAPNISILTNPDIIGSLLFEMIGFPLLALWLYRSRTT